MKEMNELDREAVHFSTRSHFERHGLVARADETGRYPMLSHDDHFEPALDYFSTQESLWTRDPRNVLVTAHVRDRLHRCRLVTDEDETHEIPDARHVT